MAFCDTLNYLETEFLCFIKILRANSTIELFILKILFYINLLLIFPSRFLRLKMTMMSISILLLPLVCCLVR